MGRGRAAAAVALALTAVAAAAPGAQACSWPLKADPTALNIAFPDEGARYWSAAFVATPEGAPLRMTISGRFPKARYMSLHVYLGGTPVDALADEQLVPKTGGNPFLAGASRRDRGTYEVDVVLGPRPARPRPNTLYTGAANAVGAVLYRVYLPEGDERGRAPLPRIALRSAGAEVPLALPLRECVEPDVGGRLQQALRDASLPGSRDVPTTRPRWTLARPISALFFPNLHNSYLSLVAPRTAGDVVVFRARAPRFPRTRRAPTMGRGDVRYWSLCSNDLLTTRYVACVADEDVPLDADGFLTVVVSDPAHRPRTLRRTDTWLPAGPHPITHLLYRHMLPDPAFAQAVQRVTDPERPEATMGDYTPDTRQCSTAAFERDRCGL